ncbi:hypothetical protein CTAYLR_004729 [Chrysophaeum taylorii]|uniref:EF-hand domain-containing protein n=1 Tax=Chrysophaeum taylorii TaxID=2483200 RepID=A0AAD7U7H5_9STRA|nr:hypothetical protein CTAYLR_004729 [Chrysophaeum taylorii]
MFRVASNFFAARKKRIDPNKEGMSHDKEDAATPSEGPSDSQAWCRDGRSSPVFEIGICEPAATDHYDDDSAEDPERVPPEISPGTPSTRKMPTKSSFTRHVLDDNAGNWRGAVSAAFRLIDRRGRGGITSRDLLWAMNEFELVRSILPQFSRSPHRKAAEVNDFVREIARSGIVNEAAWVAHFCVESPQNEHLPMPARFNATTLEQTTAFILDLDGKVVVSEDGLSLTIAAGTIYRPGALIEGAAEFYGELISRRIPFVFLSNTGAKSWLGTQLKLVTPPYKIAKEPVPMDRIMTAADAQADYMCAVVPHRARLLVVSAGDFWRQLLRDRDPDRYASWDIRTSLTDEEAMDWAVEAGTNFRAAQHTAAQRHRPINEFLEPHVVVVFFLDGDVKADEDGISGWCYQLIKHCAFLLSHGAHLIYTADDPFNPSLHDRFVGNVFPLPGPGMFASMLLPIMPPGSDKDGRWACCGKGGNIGHKFMVEKAIRMLRAQGHSGKRSSIVLVGDRFATDIRAGNRAGIKTCLVESGCNRIAERCFFPTDIPTYWAPSIGHFLEPESSCESLEAFEAARSLEEEQRRRPRRFFFERETSPKPPIRSPSMEREMHKLQACDLLRAWRLKVGRNGFGRTSRLADVRDLLKLYYVKTVQQRETGIRPFDFDDLALALDIIGMHNIPRDDLQALVTDMPAEFAAGWRTPRHKVSPPNNAAVADNAADESAAATIGASQFVYVMESFVDDDDKPPRIRSSSKKFDDRHSFSPFEVLISQPSASIKEVASKVLSSASLDCGV